MYFRRKVMKKQQLRHRRLLVKTTVWQYDVLRQRDARKGWLASSVNTPCVSKIWADLREEERISLLSFRHSLKGVLVGTSSVKYNVNSVPLSRG
jgi:hypothetical protein